MQIVHKTGEKLGIEAISVTYDLYIFEPPGTSQKMSLLGYVRRAKLCKLDVVKPARTPSRSVRGR